MHSIGVYIHIPFCVQKCVYCDFLSGPATRQRQQEYVDALLREIAWESKHYTEYVIKTIFFGGGTPSILEAEEIAKILDCLRKHYRIDAKAEITLEMNPGTVDRKKLLKLKNSGINRLSIGLQSANNAELQMLGRIHTYEDFLQTYCQAKEIGFANINIDLMSALPDQHMKSWIRTLEKVVALQPEHISAYSLIIEAGTQLYNNRDAWGSVPDEDEDRQMYQETKRILAEHGYHRYEISNYAKEGMECRHNICYWDRTSYLGFGLGAASFFDGCRYCNERNFSRYLHLTERGEQVFGECTRLSIKDGMEEFMFLGLRMTCGVSEDEFLRQFGVGLFDVYGEVIKKHVSLGLLKVEGGRVSLTDRGIDVSNSVFCDFLLDE